MSDRRSEYLRALTGPLYLVAVLLVVLPLVDLAINVWPLRPGQVEWRFGAVGLLSAYILTPVIGVAILAFVADRAPVRRAIGALCLAGAAVLLLAVPLFVLDWIQLRAQAPVEARSGIDIGSVRTVFKHLVIAGAVGWLGLVAFRRRAAGRSTRKTTPLVRTAEPSGE